jgi:hypothetical protein
MRLHPAQAPFEFEWSSLEARPTKPLQPLREPGNRPFVEPRQRQCTDLLQDAVCLTDFARTAAMSPAAARAAAHCSAASFQTRCAQASRHCMTELATHLLATGG